MGGSSQRLVAGDEILNVLYGMLNTPPAMQEVGKETDCPTPDAKAAPPVETAWLFLKGLGREAIEKPETLRNVFTQWGAGDSATLIMDPATQTRRGTAIVQMQGTEQAKP